MTVSSPTPPTNHHSATIRRRLLRVVLIPPKLLLLLIVAMMVRLQVPELRYDFGSHRPVEVNSVNDLSLGRFARPTFAMVQGKPDLTKAAVYATHGVPFTYFLLDRYGSKVVVRAPEPVGKEWADIDTHLGRLRPFHRMPFSRSVRAGFYQLFDVTIPDDAFFLARDDVPHASGWTIGAVVLASVMWCVLAYLLFLHRRVARVPSLSSPAPSDRPSLPARTSPQSAM